MCHVIALFKHSKINKFFHFKIVHLITKKQQNKNITCTCSQPLQNTLLKLLSLYLPLQVLFECDARGLPHHSPTMSLYFVSFIFLSCFLLLKNIPWYDSATTIHHCRDGFGQMMRRSWLPSDMMFDIQAKHLSLCFIAPGSFSWSESPSCAVY